MINSIKAVIVILSLMLFCHCEGPEGPMGPAGEQGSQGLQGYRGEQGDTGPPGESAPVPEFAGFYQTTNLEDTYFIFLGIDRFFAVFRQFGSYHPDAGNTILICEGSYSWDGEMYNENWIYFKTNIYDITGSENSYVYIKKYYTLRQALGEPLFGEGEGEEPVQIARMD